MSTDDVSPRERVPYWTDWIDRLFGGLQSDLYGDTDFDGHIATAHAGDVILTRLESNRHRVMRSASQVRGSEVGYLKIVAPFARLRRRRAEGPRGLGVAGRLEHLRHHRHLCGVRTRSVSST